jgi:benzoyl-CoA reductase/2-hydroxyglutaryl-CoA dehydratase subunit BcrC/BadD/HgdB
MKTIAYSSSFVPAEWIAAHGFQPHRLRLRATDGRPLPAVTRGICPYVGALMDAADKLDFCTGLHAALVLTTACDQMRYAAALLETRGSCPIFLLNAPSTWQTAAVRRLYLDELRRLGRFFARLGGKTPDNAALKDVMLAHEQARFASDRAIEECAGIRLAVLGGPLWETDDRFLDVIAQAGGCVVLDGTEGAERTMPRPFDPARIASDPLRELADAYFDEIPDAFRRPNIRLYEWLGRRLTEKQAQGIIFRRYVWCDLWHAELHRLRQWSKLPVLEIDVGPDDTGAPNRMQGRIEAFLETLR